MTAAIPTLPKIRCFLWQCCHLSIPVWEVLAARRMNISHLCPICNSGPESIIHMLRDCSLARQVWDSLIPLAALGSFYVSNLVNWLCSNCNSHASSHLGIPWNVIFPFGVWSIGCTETRLFSEIQFPQNWIKTGWLLRRQNLLVWVWMARLLWWKPPLRWNGYCPRLNGSNSIQMGLQWAIRGMRVEEASSGEERIKNTDRRRNGSKAYIVHAEHLLVLFSKRIFRFCEDLSCINKP